MQIHYRRRVAEIPPNRLPDRNHQAKTEPVVPTMGRCTHNHLQLGADHRRQMQQKSYQYFLLIPQFNNAEDFQLTADRCGAAG
jgi:pantothenate synthetase